MQSDIDRLIASLAYHFTDTSCVFLHTDELESEGRCTLVNVINKGWLSRSKSRAEFFRVLKTSVANRFRSILQQHRFTQKRTGLKPPPRHERQINFASHKPNETSLDDPNAHLQVSDLEFVNDGEDIDSKELLACIMVHCNYIERAVLGQLIEPDYAALKEAEFDARRGKPHNRIRIRITNHHRVLAGDGLINREQFEKAVLRIQALTRKIREMNSDTEKYLAAIERLAEIFHLQVPPGQKPMLLRRMFTICARDNWTLVNAEVEDLLATVGAIPPKFNKSTMDCFGILYQQGHRICESCGVKVSCATQAANAGLTEITLPPKLLGSLLTRIPILLPNPDTNQNEVPPTSNLRDMEIVDYLFANFKRVTSSGETYFQALNDNKKMLMCLGERSIPFRLRFVNPTTEIKKQLIFVNKGYYVPEDLSADQAIQLINAHTLASCGASAASAMS